MRFKKTSFPSLFIFLVLFDLACGFETFASFRLISKPLLLLSLVVYFVIQAKINQNRTFYLTLGALLSSLLGDIFLLFETQSSIFFTLGLASFLLAHLLFAAVFTQKWNPRTPTNFWLLVLFLFSYGGFLFYILKDSLDALKVPVILYILGILSMVITAYRRRENVPKSSFNLVFVGALFFVLSDSVLALDKFMVAIPLSHIIIMGTYATAQYLITRGILTQGDFGN